MKLLFCRCLPNLTLSHRTIDDIWLPNVCFQNSKRTSVHESPTPNIFLLIYPNGTIWVNYRVKVCSFVFTTKIFFVNVKHLMSYY